LSIHTKQCSYTIEGTQILKNISVSVSQGEVVSLIGANGAGKTSLLKIISGELVATSGEIFLGKPMPQLFTIKTKTTSLFLEVKQAQVLQMTFGR